jgi:hypothetical protein
LRILCEGVIEKLESLYKIEHVNALSTVDISRTMHDGTIACAPPSCMRVLRKTMHRSREIDWTMSLAHVV